MKAVDLYSPLVLFHTLYKVALTFERYFVNEIPIKCDHSNEIWQATLFCGMFYYV